MTTPARILKTAYALLYRQGFARTSMDQIADAAGLTKTSTGKVQKFALRNWAKEL